VTPRRLLVLTNSVDRSGAPIALLRLMRWCVEHDIAEPTFVTREGGELLDEFRSLGPTFRVFEGREARFERIVANLPVGRPAILAGEFLLGRWLRRIYRRRGIEMIYANTATNHRLLSRLAPLRLPVVTHVHELERSLEHTADMEYLGRVIEQSQWLLAVSVAVRQMLVAHGADERRILALPGMIDRPEPLTADERRRLRSEVLGGDDDTICVAGCGTPSLIKGTDLFLRVAQRMLSSGTDDGKRNVVFTWIGAAPHNESTQALVFDAARLGLTRQVRAIPRIDRADRALGAADIFLSPSREDANPLAAVEAAVAGRPAICFRGAGGADELADAGGALAVPYLDTDAMAVAVAKLAGDPAQRRAVGEAGREFVLARHAPDVVGGRLASLLHEQLGA